MSLNKLYLASISPILTLTLLSCSGHYIKDRARDLGDIFTVEASDRTYGASAIAGPVRIGLQYDDPDADSYGWRGGYFSKYHRGGFSFLLFGSDYFDEKPFLDLTDPAYVKKPENGIVPFASSDLTENGESSDSSEEFAGIARNSFGSIRDLRGKLYRSRSPLGNVKPASETNNLLKEGKGDLSLDRKSTFAPAHRYTGVGISLGLYYGIRIELNAGELLDFILGLATIDWMVDDEPLHPMVRKLKMHPMWDQLDSKTKEEIIDQAQRGELFFPGLN